MTEWNSVTAWGSEKPHYLVTQGEVREKISNAVTKMNERRAERDSPTILIAEEPVLAGDVDAAYYRVQEAATERMIKKFQLERERKYFLSNRKMLWVSLVAMVGMVIMSVTVSAFFGIAAFFFLSMTVMFAFSGASMINKIDQIKIDQIKNNFEIEKATNRFLRLEEEERNYNAGF